MTIDAMGCQTEIAAEIQAAGADYVLALKDNHPTLAAEVKTAFEEHLESPTAEQGAGHCHETEHVHGRTVERDVFVIPRTADTARPCQLARSRVVGDDDHPSDHRLGRNRLRATS